VTQPLPLDAVFSALSDPTRRQFLDVLSRGPQSISALAAGVDISLPAVSRHIKVLEAAGFLVREKRGRTQYVSLAPRALDDAMTFLSRTRSMWSSNLDALEAFLAAGQDL
jgi:DNA-binding transcriptional ArsR family regulator